MTTTISTIHRSPWPWQNSIQWRLVSVVLLVVLIPVIAIFAFSFLQTSNTLQEKATEDVQSLAKSVTGSLERYLSQRRGDIQVLSHAEILWGLDNTPAIKIPYLKSYQAAYNAYDSLYVTDMNGQIVSATDATAGDQSKQDWFKNALAKGDVVLSDVYHLDTANADVITVSSPVFNEDGAQVGVVAGNINIQKLIDIVGGTKIGENGEVVIVNNKGLIAVDPDPEMIFHDVNDLKSIQAALRGETGIISDINDDGDPALIYYTPYVGLENWVTFVNIPNAELYAPIQALALRAALLGLLAVLVITIAVLYVARRIVRPIQQLTGVAGRLSAGEFNANIPVSSADEIGQLAHTFRVMSRELQGLVDTLEERVENRTRDLATTIEVGRLANSIYSQKELLPQLVEYIRSKFDLYYTQIYLLDDAARFALLRAGTGDVGQQLLERNHRLDLEETSLVAQAVKSRQAVVVSDTMSNLSHKPNALLPATRSETAIPLIAGNTILGVLDMQANRPNTFTQENASVFEALAAQIAAVLRGAQAFDEAQAATARAEAVNERLTDETWGGYLGELADGHRVGYEYDLERPRPISDQLEAASDEQVSEPILVRGAQIGNIVVKNDDPRFKLEQDDEELIQDTARLVAQALDQFRAFDELKRSEENARSVQSFLDSIIENIPNMVFVKDAKDLRFVSMNKAGEDLLGIPRDQMIGKNDYNFYPEEQANGFTEKDREVLAGDRAVDIPEELIQTAGGETRYLHTKKIPIRDAQGHAQFLLGISEDITERKESQTALLESERRYRELIEEATDVVYTIDPAGFFTYISPSAKRLTGIEPSELLGKHFTEILPKGEGWRKRLVEFYLNQIEQKILQTSLIFPIMTSRGERHWVEQKVTLAIKSGQITGLQSVARDVTDRKLAEEELVLRNQAIEDSANRAQLLGLVNAALSQAIDDDQILTAISVVAEGEFPSHTTLAYVELDENQNLARLPIVASRTGDGDTVTLDTLPTSSLPPQFFTMLTRWTTGLQLPVYVEDVANDADIDEQTRAFLLAMKLGAVIAIPLRTGDEWQGIVFFEWLEPHVFSSGFRDMIESVIPTAASVVATRRSYLTTLIAREQAERRSMNMETVAQVSATAATILDVDDLLKTVSNLAKTRFGLYHAHIYLLDESGENLVLAAGAGEAGDVMKANGHAISLDNPHSIVVRAALERRAIIVNDVTKTPNFLPNVILPGTRSELALPMVVANKFIGVFDVQDNSFNRFTDEDVRVQTALANQVAVAVENGRAFQEQQKTAERLREVDRLKSQFLANMSHELRTPLNSIIGYSEVLLDGLDGDLNAEATEDVEAIHSGGRHLLTIINDILDLAKIEAGQMFLEPRETNIISVVEDVISTCNILARNKGLELIVHQEPDLPTVKGDAIRLKQIILNLVNNAIKFTDKGSITVDLATDDNQMVKVRIIDTGMGMTPSELQGLFQQFHQVDGSPTRRAGGTGLGLVITRHLVTMHGGVVDVESEKGIGTTFWFTVPVFKRTTQTVNRIVTTAT